MSRLYAVCALAAILMLSTTSFAASENAFDFENALNEVLDTLKTLDVNFFTKISLRLKITNALTYASQLFPYDLFDPEEIGEVLKESVEYGNSTKKTVSAVFAVDMAHKMGLSQEHFDSVRYTMITGIGNLIEEGVPQEFMDTVATYGEYELPPCCL